MDKPSESLNGPPEVPGDWVVDHETCMACGAPPVEAPDLMHLGTGPYPQCYFKKQPESPEEVDQACRAAWASCCDQVQYVGDDPAIHRRMSEIVPAVYLPKSRWLRGLVAIPFALVTIIAGFVLGFFQRLFGGRR